MKRLLILLPLFCLAAGDDVTFTKDNPAITADWRVWGGEWTKGKRDVLSTETGTLIASKETADRKLTFTGTLTVADWSSAGQTGMLCVLFSWDGNPFAEDSTRYALTITEGSVKFLRFDQGKQTVLGTISNGVPAGQSCPFAIQRKDGNIAIRLGKGALRVQDEKALDGGFAGIFASGCEAHICGLKVK